MGGAIAVPDRSSGTPSVSSQLTAAIPAWVDLDWLDGSGLYGYPGTLPPDAGTALREAAVAHDLALAPCSEQERQAVLFGLRSATILVDEDQGEADDTLKLLRVHLRDLPADILREACRRHCNAPGRRFFPKSAGELRVFADPLIHERRMRAALLLRLADRADREDVERQRLAEDPCTPEVIAAIKAEFGLGRPIADAAPPAPAGEPTAEAYVALGLSEEEARQAVAERARLLRRGGAKAAGAAAGDLVQMMNAA